MAESSAYAVLGLTKDADDKDVKSAYINLVKKYDPEKHTERFMVIQRAFDKLRNPKSRAQEDIHTFNVIRGEYLFQDDEKCEEEPPAEVDISKARSNAHENPGDQPTRKEFIRLLFRRAHYHTQRKQYNEAIRDWNEVIELDPSNIRARQNLEVACVSLGYSYALHGLFDESVELWERAHQLNPDNTDLIHNLALVSEKAEDGRRAGQYWAETVNRWKLQLDKEPNNNYLRTCIVEALEHHGDFVEAGRQMQKKKSQTGEQPRATPSSPATAKPSTDQAPKPGPSDTQERQRLSGKVAIDQVRAQNQQKEHDSRPPQGGGANLNRYREIAKLNPDDFDAQFQLANKLMEEQQWEEAYQHLQGLQRTHQKNVEVLNVMAWAQLNSGKIMEAFNTWKKSMSIDPKNQATRENLVRAHLLMGKSFRAKGIFHQALVHFKQLLRLMPKSPEVHLEIAATYDMKGDIRHAIAAYEEVMKLDPKNKVAKKAISDLKMRGGGR